MTQVSTALCARARITGPSFKRWEALIEADRCGDPKAYDVFVRELRAWLLHYFRRRMRGAGIEDAVQETMLAVLLKRCAYRVDGPLGPWLIAIARHKWIDTIRYGTRVQHIPLTDDLATTDSGGAICSSIVVEQALSTLKPSQRDAIRLVKLKGASIAEASVITGQSQSLVKVNIHRGMKKLASCLDEVAELREAQTN